jgi:small ligand-binding sensory domain FIST
VVSNLCCGLAPDDPLRPAAAEDAEPQDWLIRGMALTSTAHLAVGDALRVGQRLRFMVRDREGAQADLEAHGVAYKRRQLAAALEGRPAPPALGALMFSCNGRGRELYGEESFDSRQVAGYVGVPVSGFQCNGGLGSGWGRERCWGLRRAQGRAAWVLGCVGAGEGMLLPRHGMQL